MFDSSSDAVSIGHVDEVDKLITMMLDIEIEEFYEEAMDWDNVGADSYSAVIGVRQSHVSFLLHNSHLDHFFDSVGLL